MIELQNSYLVFLLAGISLFLYGMHVASANLERLMANRMTIMMNKLTGRPFLSIALGIAMTTLMQSSGAVTSMLVGLGTARVIKLVEVMGIILGTAIGSTLTVQIISFNVYQYALPLFITGFAIFFFGRKQPIKNFASVLMGFGLLFLGLKLISTAAYYFSNLEILSEFFQSLRDNQFYSLLASAILCVFVQSSAVTIGLAMSLASAGVIQMDDAMMWVYGANIGTTSTALFAAAGSNYIGRQVAWAHFFTKH